MKAFICLTDANNHPICVHKDAITIVRSNAIIGRPEQSRISFNDGTSVDIGMSLIDLFTVLNGA